MSSTTLTAVHARTLLLLAIGFDLLLIAGRVLSYSHLWSQPGALTYVLEPLVLLLLYAGIVVWVTADPTGAVTADAVRRGSWIGLLSAALWIVNLALETFAHLSALGLLATAPFLLGGFVLWGVAAVRTAQLTGSVLSGLLAALWSAMTCVLLTIAFGLLLTYTNLPQLGQDLIADPDFLRSHWHDLRGYAIANSFDSAFSHLLGALLVGALVGAAGGCLGCLGRKRAAQVESGAEHY